MDKDYFRQEGAKVWQTMELYQEHSINRDLLR